MIAAAEEVTIRSPSFLISRRMAFSTHLGYCADWSKTVSSPLVIPSRRRTAGWLWQKFSHNKTLFFTLGLRAG
jgi:hypothetical protein